MNGFGRGDEKQKKDKLSILTRETAGMIMLLFSALIFVFAVLGPYIFGAIGLAIAAFFVGMFGFFTYPLLILMMYGAVVLTFGKKLLPARWVVRFMLVVVAVFFIVHTATAERFFGGGYGTYLSGCWYAAGEKISDGTGGGAVFGLIAYPVRYLLSAPGAYIIFALLTLLAVFYLLLLTPLKAMIWPVERNHRSARTQAKRERAEEPALPETYARGMAFDDLDTPARTPMSAMQAQPEQPVLQYTPPAPVYEEVAPAAEEEPYDPYKRSREILFKSDPAASYRSNLIYSRDSAFNRGARRSSVEPVNAQPAQPAQPEPQAYGNSYAGSFSNEAETIRQPMPKRVTAPEPPKEDDFNYPPTPSFRAPEPAPAPKPAEQPTHDYYVNDVEPEFTSAPSIFDEPAPRVPEEPAPRIFEEPARPTYKAPDPEPAPEPAPRTFLDPLGRREPPLTPPAPEEDDRPSRRTLRVGFGDAEETAPRSFEEPVRRESRTDADTLGLGGRGLSAEPEEPARRESRDEDVFDLGRGRSAQPEEPVRRESRTDADSLGLGSRGFTSEPAEPRRENRTDADSLGLGRGLGSEPAETRRDELFDPSRRSSAADLFDDGADEGDFRFTPSVEEPEERTRTRSERTISRVTQSAPAPAPAPAPSVPEQSAPAPKKHEWKPYRRPSLGCLRTYDESASVPQDEIERNSEMIVDTLAAFRVEAQVVKVTSGATFTRYDINIPGNVPVGSVIKREEEIAMRLRVRDGVKMYANREYGTVSIEVPNKKRGTVGLQSVLNADEYVNAKPNALMFAIGKDVEGRNVCGNIVKMKHLLVAGATGSGKSVCLNAMLISLICKYGPEDLRLILIDPKRVEFAVFDGLPHLMINEIIAEPQKAVTALNWAIKEMERRYGLFEKKTREEKMAIRNLDEYNSHLGEDDEKMPKIVIVFDELADFMAVAKKDIEDRIQRLAAKARAAGIHLVLATQRPSVNIITGVIKSNLPTRFAFKVAAEVDSRTILDETGAQKLLGYGDLLYHSDDMFESKRVQGAFLSSDEVQAVVNDIKAHNETYFDDEISNFINKPAAGSDDGEGYDGEGGEDGDVNPQYIKALGIVVKLGQASISLIQRKCSVGYNHAGKIIEWMESMGYISPFDGKAKARTVLLTPEEYESKYGDLD